MQLPFAFNAKGTVSGTLALRMPRLVATAKGASMCEASNMSCTSLSRILAQEVSRISTMLRPSCPAKPHSTAAMGIAASIRGMNPTRRFFIAGSSFQNSLCHHDGTRHLDKAALLVHRGATHQRIGLRLAQGLGRHQNP